MARGVHGRSAALVGLPQPRSVSGQERAGCWGRVVRDGDRPRPRHGRRGQGLAGGADPAEHHAAVASRWPAGRSGLPPAISRPRPYRRRDQPGGAPQEPRRPERVRVADPGRGRVLAGETSRSGAGAGRHGCHRRHQGWVDRGGRDGRVVRRGQGRPRRRIAAGRIRRHSGHRLLAWSGTAGRPPRRAGREG